MKKLSAFIAFLTVIFASFSLFAGFVDVGPKESLTINVDLSLGNDITGQGVREKFNSYFSSWITESDFDRYGYLTPFDIIATTTSENKAWDDIAKYFDEVVKVDLDGDPNSQDVALYRDESVITLAIRDGGNFIPIFSITFNSVDECFISYPSDHYRVLLGYVCAFFHTPVGFVGQVDPAILNLKKKYNSYFESWLHESGDGVVGFITPADAIARGRDAADEAVTVREYFRTAETVDLDGNDATKDVAIYRDGDVTSLEILWNGKTFPLFSISFGDVTKCRYTYPKGLGTNFSISEDLCRLIRAAHPRVDGVDADMFAPETWIDVVRDNEVLLKPSEREAFNEGLLKQSNDFWSKTTKEPPQMWNVTKLPKKMKYAQVFEQELRIHKYPLVRREGSYIVSRMSNEDHLDMLQTTNIPGKVSIEKSEKDGVESAVLYVDKDFLNKSFDVKYGWIVRRTDMRGLPTYDQPLYFASDDDRLQYTGFAPEQPVAIVYELKNSGAGRWYYVLSHKLRGWVSADDVVQVDAKFLSDVQKQEVLTVMVPRFELGGRIYEMGTKLRVASGDFTKGYRIYVFEEDASRGLAETTKEISKDLVSTAVGFTPLFDGIVPLTRANFVRLLYTYIGTPWGWGGERRGDLVPFQYGTMKRDMYIDCSGIMANAFDAMGIWGMARNSWFQSNQGNVIWSKDQNSNQNILDVLNSMRKLPWLIGMQGHVVFYLGKSGSGTHVILHSPGSFKVFNEAGDYTRIGDGMALISEITLGNLHEKYSIAMSPK